MESLSIKEIATALEGEYNDITPELNIDCICIDSRKIQQGDLYISIIGETFDGHQFIPDAINKGAKALIVSQEQELQRNIPVIKVKDTVKALAKLSSYYREKMGKPIIAVTGSVGKTSTKDMIATALSADFNIHKTKGNFNNEIGLPLSIFGITNEHNAVVLEMGMSSLGEISYLTNIAKPRIAAITNIGMSHIEILKTQENILKAKLEIIEGLREDGLLILNGDDPLLKSVDKNIFSRIVYVGIKEEADYKAYDILDLGEKGIRFKVNLNGKAYTVELSAMGTHNVINALIGIACGMELGLNPDTFIPQLRNYHSGKMRLNIVEKDGIKFIDDTYNASPDSINAGLKVLKKLAEGGRSIAILGNMFELGDMAEKAHKSVGEMCRDLEVDFVAAIGENGKDIIAGVDGVCLSRVFETTEDIVKFMKEYLKPTDVVLLKGSRGMHMEKVLELW